MKLTRIGVAGHGGRVRHYLLAAGLAGAAVLVSRFLQPILESSFVVVLLPAVAISAWIGGFGPGLAALLLTLPALLHLVLAAPPAQEAALAVRLVTYAAASLLVTWAVAGQRAARIQLQRVYERTIDTLGEAFFTLDAQWRFVNLNQECSKLFSVPAESLRGKQIWDCFPDLAAEALGRELQRAAAAGTPVHCEVLLPDTQTWYEIHAYPSREGLAVYGHDVTGRKRAELERSARLEQLEHERALFQKLIDNIPAGVMLAEAPSGRIIMSNRQLEGILGHNFSLAPQQAAAPWELYHPDGRRVEAEEHPLARALAGEAVLGYDVLYGRGDGTQAWVRITGAPIGGRDDRITGAVIALYDVDAEKRAALALEESELRYRLLARATNEAIWDWDIATGVVAWSGAIAGVMGCQPQDVGCDAAWWEQHIHPEDRGRVTSTIAAVLEGSGENWTGEYRFLRADGSYAVVLDRGFVVRDGQGRAKRMIGSMLDVTARREAEQELGRLNEELELRVERRTAELAAAN